MNPELKHGLIIGLALGLVLGAGYLFGTHAVRLALSQYGGYCSSAILLPALAPLFRQKQADAADGRLRLGAGLYSGLIASLIAALIICSVLFAYNRFINSFWLDNALDWRVARMRAEGIGEIAIREEITFYRQVGSPAGLVATTLVGMTLVGGISSVAQVLYRRPRVEPPSV